MIKRDLEPAPLTPLRQFPVVALVGLRQVGKTTLARAIARKLGRAVYLDMERPSDAAKLFDAELYLEPLTDRLVILDEIQRRPELFPVLRSLVDAKRRNGRFIKPDAAYVVYSEKERYPLGRGVEALPVAMLKKVLQE